MRRPWQFFTQYRKRAGVEANAEASEAAVLRKSVLEAINTIKTSKLGLVRGAAALYELPWYMIIGNPAAGKSSAVGHSGLQFPLAGSKAMRGIAGTRNCDWFFTTGGILLDTAGRYAVEEGGRDEWFSFLELLRRHRRRAPINGIIIAVSVAELTGENAGRAADLARSLRTRVQELTERLGVHAPVYVVFTKADLIAGFADFFHDAGQAERERVWGATARYNRRSTPQDVLGFFDEQFDALHEGLKALSLAAMAGSPDAATRTGVFTFPPEFAGIKGALRAFLSTLFEENTYQFKPVFRGFYFTSALQEGAGARQSSKRVAARFGLALREAPRQAHGEEGGYFLLDLFRKVIFADRDLVARYTSPAATRLKYGALFAAAIVLGCSLGAWSWSALGNRQLVDNVRADLEKVVHLQEKRTDLQSRLEALEILQDRIVQLEHYRKDRPLMLSFGLYQGDRLERKLRDEYFSGVGEVMVKPVAAGLEALLAEMNANPGKLGAGAAPAARAGQAYQEASAASVADAYAALKTYLMLGDKSHAEPSHLNDQMTRYWRGWLEANRGAMAREQMIRSAERMMTFHLSQVADPAWPQVALKLGMVDSARENLARELNPTAALARVYGDIMSRAATRFPAVTVARIVGEQDQGLIAGSRAVPGAFTREAWENFVLGAIREASNKELQSTDWVLKTAARVDLTLEGSPDLIQKKLVDLYKADYANQWLRFVQGVSVTELAGFHAAVQAMNRLGDPQTSPIAKLLLAIHQQTAWDNPSGAGAAMAKAERGLADWFKETILRRAPSQARPLVEAAAPPPAAAPAMGPIGREFAGVARLVGVREKDASLMSGYLDCLSRLRTRLNQLKNQGDPGPGAKQFMQQTLEGSGSELADALKFVDEQMLTGISDPQKLALRPILVRPLMQTFAMIVLPSESEINKTWQAQVLQPFQKSLAAKYPFAPASRMEATHAEIGQFFGPEGAIAKFVNTSMGSLVVRRGDVLAARTWGEMGVTLTPQAVAGFPGWVAPVDSGGVPSHGPQTVFQLRAQPAPGTTEYTIEIDGQQLRYRNTPPAWTNMVHPSPQGVPGARITAVTFDGRTVELFNEPGQFALRRLIDAARLTPRDGGGFTLGWEKGGVAVSVDLKIVSDSSPGRGGNGYRNLRLPDTFVGRAAQAPATVAAIGNAGGQ